MACEAFEQAFDEAMDLYDQKLAEEASALADYQQAQWATTAAMGQAMMAAMLWQECLSNQGGGGGMRAMADVFSSPEKLRAKISEIQALRKSKK